jgi:AraC family transcriptional regulator
MEPLEVKIVRLEPLRVASVAAFCASPEHDAWSAMIAWLKQRELWQGGRGRRFYGFDQPVGPTGSPNRGYEVWAEVGPDVQPGGPAVIKDFPGGLYAVTRVAVTDPWRDIPSTWERLVAWVEQSHYTAGRHQWLEQSYFEDGELFDNNFTLDLHMPIREPAA